MDIMMNLVEIREKIDTIDSRFRQLWDSLLDDEHGGISREDYYNLKALGEAISPVFTKDASSHIVGNGNRFFRERTY